MTESLGLELEFDAAIVPTERRLTGTKPRTVAVSKRKVDDAPIVGNFILILFWFVTEHYGVGRRRW